MLERDREKMWWWSEHWAGRWKVIREKSVSVNASNRILRVCKLTNETIKPSNLERCRCSLRFRERKKMDGWFRVSFSVVELSWQRRYRTYKRHLKFEQSVDSYSDTRWSKFQKRQISDRMNERRRSWHRPRLIEKVERTAISSILNRYSPFWISYTSSWEIFKSICNKKKEKEESFSLSARRW